MFTISIHKKTIGFRKVNYLPQIFLKKTYHTLFLVVLFAVLPYLVPGLEKYSVLVPEQIAKYVGLTSGRDLDSYTVSSISNQSKETKTSTVNQAQTVVRNSVFEVKPGEIEDASAELDKFFALLRQLEDPENGEQQVRIAHYGDSPITNDGITSTIRQKLQQRFGDAGHGFVLAAKPWVWYQHNGVIQKPGQGWISDPISISKSDHKYGFGGAIFSTKVAGVTAEFATAEEGEQGREVTAFDIYYLAHPSGGEFEIEIDGVYHSHVSTASNNIESGFYKINVTKGSHKMVLKTVGNGEVKLFGVVLENNNRGIQYDSLGVNGAFVGLLAHYMNFEHWVEQLQHRKTDLVILGYGANESEYENLPMKQYEADTKEAIRRVRAALPDASIMLLGPMDRGKKVAGGEIISRPMIAKLTDYQRRIAAETGCAFFDTFTAMGGAGTVAEWYRTKPRLMGGDLTHPTAQGSEIVGQLIYDALMRAYEAKNIK